ncbi:hypothetical protein [Thiomonas sp. X19]|uniref:hypothetical protein n=1 Tax=Thiomonas sp. X19 TaxID=1050370 RepID=UPI001314F647|nr:hypothetical protein [Thiomonas sp. X19]
MPEMTHLPPGTECTCPMHPQVRQAGPSICRRMCCSFGHLPAEEEVTVLKR